jgi:DNA topoisomerase-1
MSKKILVIVESPGKISKIKQYLGNDYIVKASYGHVQDLDKKTLSIEVENNFNPLYITNPDKLKVVKELKDLAKDCTDIILAADGDREGEAIAYSLSKVLNIQNPKRIIFNEITKTAIQKAIESPTTIDYNMVNAQQARRILDRLVGYKISPLLWKHINDNNVKSAGRVQSAVINIIIDKENEILKSVSNPFYKIKGEFSILIIPKFCGYLNTIKKNESISYFNDENKIKEFLKLFNKKTIFKIISIENKKSYKKPSAPFITSSLQQEASTKLHFSVDKTMKVAQKLYENGFITYMRSDCPNISNDAIEEINKFIINKWGKEYSESKNYASKNSTSQDAHECIRPTQINIENLDLDNDCNKLYNLIWKRTLASQMKNAEINIQTVAIDALNNNESILLLKIQQLTTQTYFYSTFENIEFQGYLIIYDNYNLEEETSENNYKNQKCELKKNDILNFLKLQIFEDYNKLPLRYNEAGLVKYLEKNSIGRPSTYASIISKILERNYVEIKNIEGSKKESKYYELNKKYEMKDYVKEIFVGKEQKKIIPTEIGINVNNFMIEHFNSIIDINFTANFESYLDKIACGQANWVTILKTFYDTFEPIVNNLNYKFKLNKETKSNDKLLGKINNNEVFSGSGKYGPYVKIFINNKWKYSSINDLDPNSIKLEDAYELLQFPKKIGKINNIIVILNKGKYGLYLNYDQKNFSINNTKINYKDIDINFAKKIINK